MQTISQVLEDLEEDLKRLDAERERLIGIREYLLEKSLPSADDDEEDSSEAGDLAPSNGHTGRSSFSSSSSIQSVATSQTRNFSGMERYRMAHEILRAAREPLSTSEIVLRARAHGGASDEADMNSLVSAFFTAMSRHGELFRKADRGIWALSEWENEEN